VSVSARLGHANAKLTLETYDHPIPNADNEVADIFHKAFEQSREQTLNLTSMIKKQQNRKRLKPLYTKGFSLSIE